MTRRNPRAWRAFSGRDGRLIERMLRRQMAARCPCCGDVLEAQPYTRLRDQVVLDARGFDLDCRACRRFWAVVMHTPRSLRMVRMRRLAAAVRATQAGERVPAAPLATIAAA